MNETNVQPFQAQFQTFDDPPEAAQAAPRVAALRAELARRGLDGFVVPHADRFQNEYLSARRGAPRLAHRLHRIGRRRDHSRRPRRAVRRRPLHHPGARPDRRRPVFHRASVDKPPGAWIEANLGAGQKLGYDAWLHSAEGAERLAKACASAGAVLVATEPNPVDVIWPDRPAPPHGAVVPHDLQFSGEAAAHKLERVRAEIEKLKADAFVISDPHAVAWTFNIRGSDVAHTPVALAFAVVPIEGAAHLYIDRAQARPMRRRPRSQASPRSGRRRAFVEDLAVLGAEHRTVQLDQATAAHAIAQAITGHGGKAPRGADPVAAMKAVKNATEIAGSRAAHRRDGAAVTRFLAWFDRAAPSGGSPRSTRSRRWKRFRRDTGRPQGHVVPDHLRRRVRTAPSCITASRRRTNRRHRAGRDLSRSIPARNIWTAPPTSPAPSPSATPTAEMRDRFTLVLKGHIAIGRARFPDGHHRRAARRAARARRCGRPGSTTTTAPATASAATLGVHEGPQRISKLPAPRRCSRGMIVSNEPGYYKAGAYGIRIENLVLVTAAPRRSPAASGAMLGFETLTLAPIDRRLIERDLLTDGEIAWLDAYHAQVRAALTPLVDDATRAWLAAATAPLGS